ncbi:hypothetical protein FQA39_LY11044, partial [Lamprigera yunnana]
MFPYPSGNLHMGHVRVYVISDTVARFQRMNNKNVIHPIGWDAFGLPAENAAFERKVAPQQWTYENIKHMKKQLQELKCSFDWDREIATCDSSYYKWTQVLFLSLFKNGLAYRKKAYVNWDPVDKTVLADEQVDENKCSWRSGAKVERRLLEQWFVRTTRFAKDLYEGLDDPLLKDWRDIVKIQKNWIGECNGVVFDFRLTSGGFVKLWTPHPEYVECAKFVVVNSNNLLATLEGEIVKGVKLLNTKAENCLTGELLPVFVKDEFGDFHLGIPNISEQDKNFSLSVNMGGYWSSVNLQDWLISRQRYWGTPIPIVYCNRCGIMPVPEDQLPVELPQLSLVSEWLYTTCPACNSVAKRETDTMDTFMDSSWYYLRYLDVNNTKSMFDVNKAKASMPVDLYIGATLHLYYARFISHFLYSLGLLPEKEPFWRLLVQGMLMGRSFRIKGTGKYIPEHVVDIIAVHKETGEAVVISWEKMSKSKYNGVDPTDMLEKYGVDTTRLLVLADVAPTSHRNWSTSTFPGILNWQKRLWLTVQEFIHFRKQPPPLVKGDDFYKHEEFLFDSRNFYLKGANFNYSVAYQFNVAISKMQGLTNSLRKVPPSLFAYSLQFERALAALLIVLAPIAPHFASELWSGFVSAPNRLNAEINWEKNVFEQKWPDVDQNYNLDLV